MSEDQNMALRKKDSLDRMMIEANSYMESVDRHGSVSVSRFQADARMVAAPEEIRPG